jgi:hypothetical protein
MVAPQTLLRWHRRRHRDGGDQRERDHDRRGGMSLHKPERRSRSSRSELAELLGGVTVLGDRSEDMNRLCQAL